MTTSLTDYNGTIRPMTETEIAAMEIIRIEAAQKIQEKAAQIEKRQAVLDKLGLTADEAAALLG